MSVEEDKYVVTTNRIRSSLLNRSHPHSIRSHPHLSHSMASSSKHDDQRTHEVSIPLLQDNDDGDHHTSAASSSSHPPRRDVRFAISEDDAEDDAQAQDSDPFVNSQHNSKYPPLPHSLPPSYREAVYKKDPWYKSEVALSLQHYGLICFSGLGTFFRRYWPTSRFAQAGFFIVGLWIIVIVTGPTWDKSARLGWGKSVDEFLVLLSERRKLSSEVANFVVRFP